MERRCSSAPCVVSSIAWSPVAQLEALVGHRTPDEGILCSSGSEFCSLHVKSRTPGRRKRHSEHLLAAQRESLMSCLQSPTKRCFDNGVVPYQGLRLVF